MFVFKAAVVGAGTMDGDTAYGLASAGIPAVLKDVEPTFVVRGIDMAAFAQKRGPRFEGR